MSKTKYIKVAVSERLPVTAGYYFIVNRATGKQSGYFNGRTFSESFIDPEYWLEEVPDREQEMKEMLKELVHQIETFTKGNIGEQDYFNSSVTQAKELLNSIK